MEKPSLWTRVRAVASGEISADTLEAYRRASLTVLELMDRVNSIRTQAHSAGQTAWDLPVGTQTEILCAWNAFVLQSLGTEFLDADYRDHPATKGFVPPITADQVLAFFQPVEGWLGRSRRASHDPNYQVDVPLPAPVPAWSEIEPCPNTHLHGMLHAMRSIQSHAQSAVDFLGETPPPDDKAAKQYHAIRGLFASACAKAQYSDDMHGANPTQEVHEMVEPTIKEAIEAFHRVGQFAAMPKLADVPEMPPRPPAPSAPPRIPMPGEPGFDPWCLTDVTARQNLKGDREAKRAVEELWRRDPDPAATLRLGAEVEAAEARSDIRPARNAMGAKIGYFFCCPWGTVYEVHRMITLGGTKLRPGDQFVLDVTAEGTELGHPFRRHIKKGVFSPTSEFEYGDPNEAPDH